jgi:hypothetical protein
MMVLVPPLISTLGIRRWLSALLVALRRRWVAKGCHAGVVATGWDVDADADVGVVVDGEDESTGGSLTMGVAVGVAGVGLVVMVQGEAEEEAGVVVLVPAVAAAVVVVVVVAPELRHRHSVRASEGLKGRLNSMFLECVALSIIELVIITTGRAAVLFDCCFCLVMLTCDAK